MYIMGKLSKHTVGIILREYEAGATAEQLAEKYKVHATAIGYHLHKYGVKTRKNGWQKGGRNAIVKVDANPVASEMKKGMAFRTPCALVQAQRLPFWQKVRFLFSA